MFTSKILPPIDGAFIYSRLKERCIFALAADIIYSLIVVAQLSDMIKARAKQSNSAFCCDMRLGRII